MCVETVYIVIASVAANVASYYICKWLDKMIEKKPEE